MVYSPSYTFQLPTTLLHTIVWSMRSSTLVCVYKQWYLSHAFISHHRLWQSGPNTEMYQNEVFLQGSFTPTNICVPPFGSSCCQNTSHRWHLWSHLTIWKSCYFSVIDITRATGLLFDVSKTGYMWTVGSPYLRKSDFLFPWMVSAAVVYFACFPRRRFSDNEPFKLRCKHPIQLRVWDIH